MRTSLIFLLTLILLIQCKNVENIDEQKSDWIDTTKSRHYINYAEFIQKYPHSENFSNALTEYFFLRDSIADFGGCYRFNTSVSIADEVNVLLDDELKNIDSLSYYTFQYLKSGKPNISSNLKTEIQIPESNLKDSISTGRFDIVIYNKPYPIRNLQLALIEVSKGINHYKEYLSQKWFKKQYSELSTEKRIGIDKLNDQRLLFFDFTSMKDEKWNPPPKSNDFDNNKTKN